MTHTGELNGERSFAYLQKKGGRFSILQKVISQYSFNFNMLSSGMEDALCWMKPIKTVNSKQ
jgi:hypothetical protein